MEVSITEHPGIPQDAIISVRFGTTRRQATMQVAMAHPLTFPTPLDACCEPLKIDVLQQLSSKRLVIQSDQANYRIGLDGQGMAVGLSVRSVRGGEGKQQARAARPDAAALLKQDTANSAREYLESHGLLRYVQALLHAVIQVRPEDPYEFMREQLTAGQDGPSAVHAAAAPPPAMAAEAARAPAGETAAPAEAAPPPPQEEADAPPPPPLAPPSPPKRPTGVKPPAAEPPTLEVEPADAAAEAAGSPPEVAEEAARGTRSSPEAPCYGDQHEAPPLPSQGITLEEFRAQTLDALKVARENGTLEAHLERALGRQPSQEATAVAAALEAAEAAPPAAEAAVPGSARPEARAAGAVAPAEAPAAGAGAAGGGATGRALLVVTSAALLGGHPCGLWSEACTGPYFLFKDAGYSVRVVSIAGGDVPVDRSSLSATFKTENDVRMDNEAVNPLKGTGKLADEDASQYDIILFAGGHGACVDFSTEEVGNFVSRAAELGKVLAAVCHGTVALVHATVATQEGGQRAPLVKGRNVACFSDAEEEQIQLAGTVPFLVEAKLKELGALVENVDPWADQAVRDGWLVTGQNPQSSVSCARLCLEAARERRAAPRREPAGPPAPLAVPPGRDPAVEACRLRLRDVFHKAVDDEGGGRDVLSQALEELFGSSAPPAAAAPAAPPAAEAPGPALAEPQELFGSSAPPAAAAPAAPPAAEAPGPALAEPQDPPANVEREQECDGEAADAERIKQQVRDTIAAAASSGQLSQALEESRRWLEEQQRPERAQDGAEQGEAKEGCSRALAAALEEGEEMSQLRAECREAITAALQQASPAAGADGAEQGEAKEGCSRALAAALEEGEEMSQLRAECREAITAALQQASPAAAGAAAAPEQAPEAAGAATACAREAAATAEPAADLKDEVAKLSAQNQRMTVEMGELKAQVEALMRLSGGSA